MNTLWLSVLMLHRDWRVLFIALVLAVGSIATVGLFADRIRIALQQEASSLLGTAYALLRRAPCCPNIAQPHCNAACM